jgi:hypothetical protein
MIRTKSSLLFFLLASLELWSCSICIGGGELVVKKNYVYNKCGLLNGVSINEIKVNSFQNNVPSKYIVLRGATLYRQGASPNNDPKRLYFDKDCKENYIYQGDQIIDTIKGPMAFNRNAWYLLQNDDTNVFMFIDDSGNRKLFSQQKLKVNY